jgi:hypothetical protein
MHSTFKKLKCIKAQATVEAALVLPIILTLILLLIQPAIYIYDLIVINSAASETVRLLCTKSGSNKNVEDYVRRRLSAIPQVDTFHIHSSGCSYEIQTWESGGNSYGVRVKNELKPLPLIDIGLGVMGILNSNGNLVIEVSREMRMQPEWTNEG